MRQYVLQVQWKFHDGEKDGFKDYPPDVSYKIERAYLNKEKSVEWSKGSTKMAINFEGMKGYLVDNPDKTVTVRRVDLQGDKL